MEKVRGDILLSWSVNGSIAVEVRANALARDSQYQRIVELVRAEVSSGEAAVYVAVDGRFAGVVILRDALRVEAKSTIPGLAAMGVRNTIMLTGDVEQTARPIGQNSALPRCTRNACQKTRSGLCVRPHLDR